MNSSSRKTDAVKVKRIYMQIVPSRTTSTFPPVLSTRIHQIYYRKICIADIYGELRFIKYKFKRFSALCWLEFYFYWQKKKSVFGVFVL